MTEPVKKNECEQKRVYNRNGSLKRDTRLKGATRGHIC